MTGATPRVSATCSADHECYPQYSIELTADNGLRVATTVARWKAAGIPSGTQVSALRGIASQCKLGVSHLSP